MSSPKLFSNSLNQQYEIAAFWLRMLAFMLDSLIIIMLVVLFWNFIGTHLFSFLDENVTMKYEADGAAEEYESLIRLISNETSLFLFIGFPYHLVAEQSSWQGSPAKRIFGLRVANKEGEKPSFFHSLFRNIFKFSILFLVPSLFIHFLTPIVALFVVVWVLIVMFAANDKYNRFLSDFPTQSFVLVRKQQNSYNLKP
jgi:uncharacterized RDD family membrane protein YckC